VPALPPYIIEPVWQQFEALLPEHESDHPLGCHRRRIPDRVVFEKLVQVLVFGCAYERIADGSCSESTLSQAQTRRVDRAGASGNLAARGAGSLRSCHWSRPFGCVAVDCCMTKKAPLRRGESRQEPGGPGQRGNEALGGRGRAGHTAGLRHGPRQPPRLAAVGPHPGPWTPPRGPSAWRSRA
jgi:transposase